MALRNKKPVPDLTRLMAYTQVSVDPFSDLTAYTQVSVDPFSDLTAYTQVIDVNIGE